MPVLGSVAIGSPNIPITIVSFDARAVVEAVG